MGERGGGDRDNEREMGGKEETGQRHTERQRQDVYRLDIKCPSKVHMLRPPSQSMALSEGDRSFSKLGPMGGI